jgi:hypothetical protein
MFFCRAARQKSCNGWSVNTCIYLATEISHEGQQATINFSSVSPLPASLRMQHLDMFSNGRRTISFRSRSYVVPALPSLRLGPAGTHIVRILGMSTQDIGPRDDP